MTCVIKDYTTKGKNNFNEIEINNDDMRPVKRGLTIPCYKNINAFDFEVLTHARNGIKKTLPVMLGVASVDGRKGDLIESKVYDSIRKKKWLDIDYSERRDMLLEILKILTNKNYRDEDSLNFFYNIKYDFGIIVSLMSEKEIETLYKLEKVEIGNYIIKTVGNKMFTITKKNIKRKRHWTFYDLANFTMQSLNKATKEWLGDEGGKLEGFDTQKVFNNEEVLREVYNTAVEYCKRDVEITAKLGFEIRKRFEEMGIPFSRPISTASLFKAYMAFHNKPYPTFDTVVLYDKNIEELKEKDMKKYEYIVKRKELGMKLQELAWEGYYGGLFEIYKRGYSKDVVGLDYNSMYPSIMVDLPDLTDCYIDELLPDICSQETIKKQIKQSDWSVIKAKVWTKPGKIQIFPVRAKIKTENGISEKVIRPVMNGQEVVMSKQMFEFFTEKYPHFKAIEIVGGYTLREKPGCKRPFDWYRQLYNQRIEIIKKSGKSDKRQLVIKIILNAGYGVTAETVPVDKWAIEEDGALSYEKTIIKPGKFFRPFYAFHITELARLRIYKDIFECDIEDDIIAVATDCIFVAGEGKEKLMNSPNYEPKEKILGKLMLDKEGEMLAIGNGVYLFKDKAGNVKKTSRGFNIASFPNLFEECHDLDKIPVENTRPKTWREIAHKFNFNNSVVTEDDIGVFFEEEKECNINMDFSRVWEGKFKNVGEMFIKTLDSKPFILEEV